jgi:hypothetical protein
MKDNITDDFDIVSKFELPEGTKMKVKSDTLLKRVLNNLTK